MRQPSLNLVLAACAVAATMTSSLAGSASATFSGKIPSRQNHHFRALDDVAVHSGREAGFRLRIVNRSGRAERLKLELAAADRDRSFRLIGFDPVLAPGATTDFLMIVAAGGAAGGEQLNLCLDRQAGNQAVRRECIALRTRPLR